MRYMVKTYQDNQLIAESDFFELVDAERHCEAVLIPMSEREKDGFTQKIFDTKTKTIIKTY